MQTVSEQRKRVLASHRPASRSRWPSCRCWRSRGERSLGTQRAPRTRCGPRRRRARLRRRRRRRPSPATPPASRQRAATGRRRAPGRRRGSSSGGLWGTARTVDRGTQPHNTGGNVAVWATSQDFCTNILPVIKRQKSASQEMAIGDRTEGYLRYGLRTIEMRTIEVRRTIEVVRTIEVRTCYEACPSALLT